MERFIQKHLKKRIREEKFQFTSWVENILTRNMKPDSKKEVVKMLQDTRPEEVEEMISNVERVLKKSYKDAEKQGIEQGILKVAKQMLIEGEDIEKIEKYTGLSKETIEQLK